MGNDLWTVVLGVATLFMRQTNVFWVVVYMGGLEVVHAVRSLKPPKPEEKPSFSTLPAQLGFYLGRWSVGDIEDPPLGVAWPDGMLYLTSSLFAFFPSSLIWFVTDWLLCLASIAVAVICNPARVLRQVWPHVTVLILFAAFVAWNGGVVLGKSLPFSFPPHPRWTTLKTNFALFVSVVKR